MKRLLFLTVLFTPLLATAQDYTTIRQKLEKINTADQQYRLIIDSLVRREKLSWNDPKIQQWIPIAARQDSLNLAEVRTLLDSFGWLGVQQVGSKANETQFLIIQHADSSLMLQYFPLLVQSYELGQTPPKYYAMMLDRILTDRGKKQVYGTQLRMESSKLVPFPIEMEKEVDRRRKKVGLGTLAAYLQSFNS